LLLPLLLLLLLLLLLGPRHDELSCRPPNVGTAHGLLLQSM
jgi:hypothetical protein